jgi:hypothetical protein
MRLLGRGVNNQGAERFFFRLTISEVSQFTCRDSPSKSGNVSWRGAI